MSAPAAVMDLLALKTQLATITVANGYRTDMGGAVFTGRDALAVGSQRPLPTITLTSTRDDPTDRANLSAGQWCQGWTRTVELEIQVAGADAWETALDNAVDDVRRALARHTSPLTLGGIAFTPPASGGETAMAVMSLTYSYIVDYS